MKYHFEIGLPWAPACGYLRSPFGRDTWDLAFREGREYLENGARHRTVCSLRVIAVDENGNDVPRWLTP